MAMGKRKREEQGALWIATAEPPKAGAHPFYEQVNNFLDAEGFDRFAEQRCRGLYADELRRASLPPAIYFRLLLIGYFEAIDGERGIVWQVADPLARRRFLGFAWRIMWIDVGASKRPVE